MASNEIKYKIAIRAITLEQIEQSRFAKLLVTYLDDNSEGELWIKEEKTDEVGLTPDLAENRTLGEFPVVEVTLVPTAYKKTKLRVAKLEKLSD